MCWSYCVCVCVYVCECMCVCVRVCDWELCICLCVWECLSSCVCVCVCTRVCVYRIWVCVWVLVRVFVCGGGRISEGAHTHISLSFAISCACVVIASVAFDALSLVHFKTIFFSSIVFLRFSETSTNAFAKIFTFFCRKIKKIIQSIVFFPNKSQFRRKFVDMKKKMQK